MARFTRLHVLQTILDEAVLPILSHGDADGVCAVAHAVAKAGLKLFELTNRNDHAIDGFKNLVRYCEKTLPGMIVGAGSISDEATAALYIAHGANFIVGPTFDQRVARFCNRRRVAYLPGCQTLTEIGIAEEHGVEIIKLFPCEAAGGPGFVKQLLGPSPHTRILSTGLSDTSPATLHAWFKAGVCAIGVGREIMPPELIAAGDWSGITLRASEFCSRVQQARTTAQPER